MLNISNMTMLFLGMFLLAFCLFLSSAGELQAQCEDCPTDVVATNAKGERVSARGAWCNLCCTCYSGSCIPGWRGCNSACSCVTGSLWDYCD